MTRTLLVLLFALAMTGGGEAQAQPARHPASAKELLGRWVPSDSGGAKYFRQPFVEFRPDGQWNGSDGCNSVSARWELAADGAFAEVSRVRSTRMACPGFATYEWWRGAVKVMVDGDTLVFLDAAGTERARLRRG